MSTFSKFSSTNATPLQRYKINRDCTSLSTRSVGNAHPQQRFNKNHDTTTHSDHTVRQLVLAVRTHQLCLWQLEPTDGTRGEWFLLFCLVGFPHDHLNLLLVLEVDGVAVLWAHQHGCIAEGGVFEVGAVTFDDGGCQYGDNI